MADKPKNRPKNRPKDRPKDEPKDEPKRESAPSPPPAPPAGVLQPGAIKFKRDPDEVQPWWYYAAIFGGIVVLSVVVLGVVSLIGRGTPPRQPLAHQAPEAAALLDLDDVRGGTLAKHAPIPGAGAIIPSPGQNTGPKVASKSVARGRRFGRPALPVIHGPAEPPKPKPSGAIFYQPRGPGL